MSNYYQFSPLAKLAEKGMYPPYPRGSSKFYDWKEEQEYYLHNGFQAGGTKITGYHYGFLNFNHIGISNSRGNKIPTYPYFVDSHKEFFDKVEYCYANEKNLIGLKGRDKGWTYLAAWMALQNMMFEDGSSVLCLTPGGTSVAKAKFRAAYDMSYDNLDSDFKYPYIKNTSGKNQDQIIYGWEEEDENGVFQKMGPMSTLDVLVAVNSSVVRAGRSKLIIIEEFGEIDGGKNIIGVADANMREGAKKFGMLIAGGTSNHLNDKGFKDFRDIWYNPEQFDFERIFIPAQKGCWGYVNYKTGVSDEEGAKKHHEAIRKKKKDEDLDLYKQENPFTEAEAFIVANKSPFKAELCAIQTAKILSSPAIKNAIQRGNLYAKKTADGIQPVWELDEEKGKWLIFKHPDSLTHLRNWVVGGVDSYRLGEVEESDSKGAIEVYVPEQGPGIEGSFPVCIYLHRESDKDVFFMDSLLTSLYYRRKLSEDKEEVCKMLIEYTDEDIITFYRQRGMLKCLKERPSAIPTSKYSVAEYKYGIKPTSYNRSVGKEYAITSFNQNWDYIVFVELLDEMSNFGMKNTDRCWAHIWAVTHAMDNIKVLEEYKAPKKERPFMPFTAVGSDGRPVVIYNKEMAQRYGLMPREVPQPNRTK